MNNSKKLNYHRNENKHFSEVNLDETVLTLQLSK